MGVDGWDGARADGGDAEAGGLTSPQVPNQGGRAASSGDRAARSLPAQREGSALPPPPDAPPADGELIERMRAGDDSAYEELYRRHADAVRRYARTCCRDGHTADDLTAEVFARMLQAVRGGSGPEYAVRAYLLTSVRRVAAHWTQSAKREHLVDDFAVFAQQASRAAEVADDTGSLGAFGADLGADVRAMHEAEQTLAMQAFRSLPERWQAVLWHTEVEDESPSEVAVLFGLDANGTRVLASRAREGLKQAYLQAHVSATLVNDEECARYADQLGATRVASCVSGPSAGCASTWRSAPSAVWRPRRSRRWPAGFRPSSRSRSSAGSAPPGTPRRSVSSPVARAWARRVPPLPRPGPRAARRAVARPRRGWARP